MLVGLLTTMAACGGDKKNSCEEPETFGKAIGCAMAPKILGESVVATQYDEFEPNNSLDNANIVTLPIASANLTSGLAYYVQVHGYNTGQENHDYRLIITG